MIAEGVALPLVHTAWITALVFSLLNAWLLSTRIRVETRWVISGWRMSSRARVRRVAGSGRPRNVAANANLDAWDLSAGYDFLAATGRDQFLLVREELEPKYLKG